MRCANAEISGTIWLAMITSICDWGTKQVGVISELFVDFVLLDDVYGDKAFGISVTNGMLDCVSSEIIATRIAHSLYRDVNKTDDKKNNYYHP